MPDIGGNPVSGNKLKTINALFVADLHYVLSKEPLPVNIDVILFLGDNGQNVVNNILKLYFMGISIGARTIYITIRLLREFMELRLSVLNKALMVP